MATRLGRRVKVGPRRRPARASAVAHVQRFEKLAKQQARLDRAKRDPRRLGRTLAVAIKSANARGDRDLQDRLTKAARPLLRSSPLFTMKNGLWAISLEGKVYSMAKCVQGCRDNNPPGWQREACEAACALWILFCGGSEIPDNP